MRQDETIDLDADIERMIAIRRNRRELGWSYFGLIGGGGNQIATFPLSAAERKRRSREAKASKAVA